ncbi:MAG: YcxB family protein [Clostridia bacterium]|nr:YcxB family protein [Clostridia bacterium]
MAPYFTLDIEMTPERYEEMNEAAYKADRKLICVTLACSALFLLLAILSGLRGDIAYLIVLLLAAVGFPFLIRWLQRRAIAKAYASDRDLAGKYHYEFFEEGYTEDHGEDHQAVAYDHLYKIVESGDAYLLLQSRIRGAYFRKDECDEELLRFFGILEETQKTTD